MIAVRVLSWFTSIPREKMGLHFWSPQEMHANSCNSLLLPQDEQGHVCWFTCLQLGHVDILKVYLRPHL
jgi:hypothetical protein